MSNRKRNANPYAGVDWNAVPHVAGATHVHCVTPHTLQRLIEQGMEFFTLSNYYPSAPWYPLASIRENSFCCAQNGGILNGKYTPAPIALNTLVSGWIDELAPEFREKLPFTAGERLFPELPAHLLEAPNAEHHAFADCSIYLHVTAPGATLTSGHFDHDENFQFTRHGLSRGFPLPWREAFGLILDSLQSPDGGGIVINHPSWSHLPLKFLEELLDFSPSVLGIEIYNRGSEGWYSDESTTEWDALLSSGRQCFGFCVPDHPAAGGVWHGRIVLLPEERTAAGCLRAMRQGRFYGAILGNGLRFERIELAGNRLSAVCNREVDFQLLSAAGVVEDFTGTTFHFTLPEFDRTRHRFLRLTAREGRRGEMLFAQPFMLI